MSERRVSTLVRTLLALLVAGWLGAGLAGAYTYVHRYMLYRGFPAPATPAGIPRGTVEEVHFWSPSVRRTDRYLVYLPPGYSAQAARGRRFPVLYLLHGYPGTMSVFIDVDKVHVDANVLIARHEMRPMIMVIPAGEQGILHGDTEWANAGAGRWENFVIDVVHDVDHRFATLANRQHRALAGDSEGAYGATNIALHHLGMFSALQSWGGYFTETATGVFSHATPAQLYANSPAEYVSRLAPRMRRLGLRAWLFQGRTDSADPDLLRSFGAALHAAGADVHVGFFPGGHDWGLWRAQTPRMLRAASRWFSERPRARAQLTSVGRSLPNSVLRRIHAHRHCLKLRPGRRGVHITPACRAYRARVLRKLASGAHGSR